MLSASEESISNLTSPYFIFRYSIRNELTRKYYERRLHRFFDYIDFLMGSDIGYESDTGAHGHRGYNERMMFTWIGAAVDIPYKVHKYLGTLGPKLYFLRIPRSRKSEDDYLNELDKNFADKLEKVQSALDDYLNWFEKYPDSIIDEKSR